MWHTIYSVQPCVCIQFARQDNSDLGVFCSTPKQSRSSLLSKNSRIRNRIQSARILFPHAIEAESYINVLRSRRSLPPQKLTTSRPVKKWTTPMASQKDAMSSWSQSSHDNTNRMDDRITPFLKNPTTPNSRMKLIGLRCSIA